MSFRINRLFTFTIVVAALCFGVCSCSDNDPDDPSTENKDPDESKKGAYFEYTIVGSVRDNQDNPVKDATIIICSNNWSEVETITEVKTDNQGKYSYVGKDYETAKKADWRTRLMTYDPVFERNYLVKCIPPVNTLKSAEVPFKITYKVTYDSNNSDPKKPVTLVGKGSYGLNFILSAN